jgi:hypothetical protein
MELVIGILGVVLGAASLVWQAATHRLTGGRARLEMFVGVMAGERLIAGKPSHWEPEYLGVYADQGYGPKMIGVKVFATGRMPVTIVRWGLLDSVSGFDITGAETVEGLIAGSLMGPPLPHTIPAGGPSAIWGC